MEVLKKIMIYEEIFEISDKWNILSENRQITWIARNGRRGFQIVRVIEIRQFIQRFLRFCAAGHGRGDF